MNDGVKILIERMQTHPEEFIGGAGFAYSKWGVLISEYKEHLDAEDRTALTDALCKLHQQAFTEKVMEELVEPKKSNKLDEWVKANATRLATPTPSPYMDKATIEHMKIHVEALQAKDRNELMNKKTTTLFGRLFNYQ